MTNVILVGVNKRKYVQEDQVLGSGTYGVVKNGRHIYSDASVKKIKGENPNYKSSPVAIKAFRSRRECEDECSVTQAVSNYCIPHAVRYRDRKVASRQLRFNMMIDLIPGQTLNKFCSSLDWTNILSIAGQLLEFLVALNKVQILHGDLKSANVMFEPEARYVTVLDFGISRKSQTGSVLSSTEAYTVIQSLYNRAPEILLGLGHTTRADLWSFGTILYELVTGLPFFAPGTDYAAAVSQTSAMAKRKDYIQRLFSIIDLPSATAVEKIQNLPTCLWKVKDGVVVWKSPVPYKRGSWEFFFRMKAAQKNAHAYEIEILVSILKKILCFENRASVDEIMEEFRMHIPQEVHFNVVGLERNHRLVITSGKVQTVYDNSLRVHRSCLHVPRDSHGTYLVSLTEGTQSHFVDLPIQVRGNRHTITIAELLQSQSSSLMDSPPISDEAKFVPGVYFKEYLFDPNLFSTSKDLP